MKRLVKERIMSMLINEVKEKLKNGLNNTSSVFKAMYILKIFAVIVLCRIHDFTRYKVCRSFTDLFYWPEGWCIDMLVVFLIFLLGAFLIIDDLAFLNKSKVKIDDETENKIIQFPGEWR